MQVGYRVMMALFSLIMGIRFYFGFSAFQVEFLKLNGFIYLVVGVILICSCFSDLPTKVSKPLVIYSLGLLELFQCKLLIECDWSSAGIELTFLIVYTILILIMFIHLLIDFIRNRAVSHKSYIKIIKG